MASGWSSVRLVDGWGHAGHASQRKSTGTGSWLMDVTTVDLRPSPPQTGWQWLRLVGNVVNPTTPSGLVVALIGDAKIRQPRGLFLCEGYQEASP